MHVIMVTLFHTCLKGPCTLHFTESYAPFLSMSVRESFLTVNESLAAAPGPGHYAPGFAFQKTKGGGSLDSRVCISLCQKTGGHAVCDAMTLAGRTIP